MRKYGIPFFVLFLCSTFSVPGIDGQSPADAKALFLVFCGTDEDNQTIHIKKIKEIVELKSDISSPITIVNNLEGLYVEQVEQKMKNERVFLVGVFIEESFSLVSITTEKIIVWLYEEGKLRVCLLSQRRGGPFGSGTL
jgi:hypothetical protein